MTASIENIGDSYTMGGDHPVLLNDEKTIWVVLQGQVDVFYAGLLPDGLTGRRTYMFRARKGDILFGMDVNKGHDTVLLDAGNTNTHLIKLDQKILEEQLKKDQPIFKAFKKMTEDWICNLSAGLIRKGIIPGNIVAIEPLSEISSEADTRLGPITGVVWAKIGDGDMKLMGRKDWPVINKGAVFPLAAGTWLHAQGKSELSCSGTDSIIRQADFFRVLSAYHSYILNCISVNISSVRKTDREKLERRITSDHVDLENSLWELSSVLCTGTKRDTVSLIRENNLPAIFELVAKAAGIPFDPANIKKLNDNRSENSNLLNSPIYIADRLKIRIRKVILKGKWWEKDLGPLLGFSEGSDRPIALIPTSSRSYCLIDSESRSKVPVTEKNIPDISPHAYCFYRQLPDRIATVMDLARTGIRDNMSDLYMVIIMGLCGGLLGLLPPVMTKYIFDSFIPEASRLRLYQTVAILVTCAMAVGMFDITKGFALQRLTGRVDGTLQAAVWDRLLRLPVSFFKNYAAGDLAVRAMGISNINMILSNVMVTGILTAIFSLFNFFLLFYYDTSLALIAVAVSIVSIFITFLMIRINVKYQRIVSKLEGENSGMILQFLTGISKLRVSGSEDRAFSAWAKKFTEKKKYAFKAGKAQNIQMTVNAAFPVLASMAIFAWMIFKSESLLSTGVFLAFNAAFFNFQNALMQMFMALAGSVEVIPLYERIKPVFDTMPEADESKASPGALKGRIDINHIGFRYNPDGDRILKDLSLHVSPGEFIAIVGESGSGKSTLLRLLLGFEKPESGTIFFDDHDIETHDLLEIRRQLGVVLQNGTVMQGDIFRNIVGSYNLTLDDAWEAAGKVGLEKDIKEMPMGMHTVIPQGGGTLSGGQCQRIMIAKAIVKKPKILIFDEATSALDNRTQAIVGQSLENLKVTRIVIAHRLSTIMNADRIYVLQKGRVTQVGKYDELIRQDGFFAELVKRQTA